MLVQVKYRIAVGLSKEGWAILQNLLTLLCIMSLSMLVFNYTMREFCVIALVGVLCDSFLQLIFFTTVLSIDLRRLEVCDLWCFDKLLNAYMYICVDECLLARDIL